MEVDGKIVAKSGIWYALSNILVKATAFLTTPLFTRLLTKDQYGNYSNIASWVTIFTILTGFDAYTTVIRSKHDVGSDMNRYVSSVYLMNVLVTSIVFSIVLFFWNIFEPILSVEKKYVYVMALYLLVLPAFNLFMTKQRAYYRYKLFAAFTVITTLLSAILSVVFVLTFENKLDGRVLGQYLPAIILYFFIAVCILVKGKGIKYSYISYAFKLSLPLVPHLLSLNILSSSDRIMIKNICGAEMAALYSVDYNCVQIGNILFDSINKAWAPWLMDALHAKEYQQIKKVSNIYFFAMLFIIIGILLVGPEIIFILGGQAYTNAKWALPPLLISCIYQVAYTMYVNVEFYLKKTGVVAGATLSAAVINLVLNVVLIPRYGFVAAAFTTLISYVALYIIHYVCLKKMKMTFIFSEKKINAALFLSLVIMLFIFCTYEIFILKLLFFIIYIGIAVCVIYKTRDKLLGFWMRRK